MSNRLPVGQFGLTVGVLLKPGPGGYFSTFSSTGAAFVNGARLPQLIKYNAAGALAWDVVPPNMSDMGFDNGVALDAQSNIYATGATENFETVVVKYGKAPPSISLKIASNPPSVFPSGISGSTAASQTQVLVRVVDSFNKGIPNQTVKLDAFPPIFGVSPEDELGGHSHDDNRPIGTFPGGKCAATSGNICIEAEMTCVTEGDGICRISGSTPVYAANSFGGQGQIGASLVSTPTISTFTFLEVSVSNLTIMPDGPGYVLTGQTAAHPINHYVFSDSNLTTDALRDLQAAAIEFSTSTLSTMRINDISLQNGGGFDIFGRWNTDVDPATCRQHGHCKHRLGTSVDVENLDLFDDLIDAMADHHWDFIDEGQLEGTSTRFPHFEWDGGS